MVELFHLQTKEITLLMKCRKFDNVDRGCTKTQAIIYLHGFPDLSIHPKTGEYFSRLPRKLDEKFQSHVFPMIQTTYFITFNCSGLPGSTGLEFADKSISQERKDVEEVINHVATHLCPPSTAIHVVGLSTGAILAALSRPLKHVTSVTAIAGLVDLAQGVCYDFDASQRDSFERKNYCMKEFYYPKDYPLPTPTNDQDLQVVEETATAIKIWWKLNRKYYDECVNNLHNIRESVSTACPTPAPPLLVIHGDQDRNVPMENGLALFQAAAEPKQWVEIHKANHLFTDKKHMKKLLTQVTQHIERTRL